MFANAHFNCVLSHIVALMYLATDGIGVNELAKCRWCEATIGLAHNVKHHVCVNCFKRLRDEAIPINEIIERSEMASETS